MTQPESPLYFTTRDPGYIISSLDVDESPYLIFVWLPGNMFPNWEWEGIDKRYALQAVKRIVEKFELCIDLTPAFRDLRELG